MRLGNGKAQCEICDKMSKGNDVFYDFALPEVTTAQFAPKNVPAPLCACPDCAPKIRECGKKDSATGFFIVDYRKLYHRIGPGRLRKVIERVMIRNRTGIIVPK